MCDLLFWLDTFLLPSNSSDWVRIPANVVTSALWGVVLGGAVCLLALRPDR
jgi:hypothetical protein